MLSNYKVESMIDDKIIMIKTVTLIQQASISFVADFTMRLKAVVDRTFEGIEIGLLGSREV